MRKPTSFLLLSLCVLASLGLLALSAFNPLDGEPRSELLLFIGRFHPVILHLPIGLLVLLLFMEVLVLFERASSIRPAINLVLALAILSCLGAIGTGFLLAFAGGADEPLVREHMQSGLWLGVACLGLGGLKLFGFHAKRAGKVMYRLTLAATFLLLLSASHDGGSITHGRDYLTKHMPDSVRSMFRLEVIQTKKALKQEDLMVFEHLVHPVIEQKCQSCHNPDKLKGELNLETYEGYLVGGEMGPAIVPNDLETSEMHFRITLAPDDEEFMPTDEKPALTEEEVALIEWWIVQGASRDAKLSDMEDVPSHIDSYAGNVFSKMLSPEERQRLEDERKELYARLSELKEKTGLLVEPLEPQSTRISVHAFSISKTFEDEALRELVPFAKHIARADFSATRLSDSSIAILSKFENLESLNLSNTNLYGSTLGELARLEKLETLNLYGAKLDIASASELAKLKQLKKLYLYQTALDEDPHLDKLQKSLPNCALN